MPQKLMVFVCTGNICRSPMAEYMMRDRLRSDSAWHITSAGTMAAYGVPASMEAVSALAEKGIELRGHLSRPVTPDLVDAAAVIVVMTRAHLDQLSELFPEAREKIFLLKSFLPEGGDVPDPIGLPLEVYRDVRDEIAAALPELVSFVRQLDADPRLDG